MAGPGFISLRDAIFGVGPTFARITGTAKGDAIKIVQPDVDGTIIGGSQGGATFVVTEDRVRRIELSLLPSDDDVTLLMQLRALKVPFPFSYEFGATKMMGFWLIEKDVDIVVSDNPQPIMVAGPAFASNKLIAAQGISLQ